MIYLLEFTDTRDGSTFTDAIIGKDDDECKRNLEGFKCRNPYYIDIKITDVLEAGL